MSSMSFESQKFGSGFDPVPLWDNRQFREQVEIVSQSSRLYVILHSQS